MKKTIFIGLDSGKHGGMAVFYPDGKRLTYKYAKELSFNLILREIANIALIEGYNIFAMLEALSGFQGENRFQMRGSQTLKMGETYGKIQGWLEAYDIPFRTVVPRTWQKNLPQISSIHEYGAKKRALNLLAKQRFPELKPTLETCDAILIADYAKSIYKD